MEFSRKLKTGHPDDADLSAPGTYLMGVAVFDKSEDEHHYTAGPITLELGSAQVVARTFTFDRDSTGVVPNGWSIGQTNSTKSLATWQVVADPTAPSKPNVMALANTENSDRTFNLAIAEGTSFTDLDLTLRVKAVSGDVDQGGGPIWRCRDENNYYICRFNPLESNLRVYKVVNGERKQLDSAMVGTRTAKWHTIRVRMVGEMITCYLDGKELLRAKDGTFRAAGTVGLWTKADAATWFDDLVVNP